jgi:hypothetical protein
MLCFRSSGKMRSYISIPDGGIRNSFGIYVHDKQSMEPGSSQQIVQVQSRCFSHEFYMILSGCFKLLVESMF